MIPPKDKLLPYNGDKGLIAKDFKVTVRTVYRWLKFHNLESHKENFGPYKLNEAKAKEIRNLHTKGVSVKELAEKYGVTVAAVGRILNNVTYREVKETAEVFVVYNPTNHDSSG